MAMSLDHSSFPSYNDTRWLSRVDEISSDASDHDYVSSPRCSTAPGASWSSTPPHTEDLLAPTDLVVEEIVSVLDPPPKEEEESPPRASAAAHDPSPSPSPSRPNASLNNKASASRQLCIQRRDKADTAPLKASTKVEDHQSAKNALASLPVPLTIPTNNSSAMASSSGDSSDDLSPGGSLRRSRRMSRISKSPEGPKFASGAYKNAPPPASLPPPPPDFYASMPVSVVKSPPIAGPALLSPCTSTSTSPAPIPDPAIIAIAPIKPVDLCQQMTSQLCQLLKIKA